MIQRAGKCVGGAGIIEKMAGLTGLEPATSCVTGRRSNQLNYNPARIARAKPTQPSKRRRIGATGRRVN